MILHFVLLKMLNTFASVLANGISAMFRINSSSSGKRKKFQEDHRHRQIYRIDITISSMDL